MSSFPPPYPYFNGITYDRAFFNPVSSGLTLSQANAKFLKKTTPDIATALETFQSGIQTDLIKSNGGFGGTIYTDPGPTQTYATLVCQNNSTCSFGGSAGTCNLGGLSSGINIGYNMSNGTQIAVATAASQDTNIAIATKGIYPSGVNKILIGATANTTTLASGTININSPLTPAYTYPVSSSTQLGYSESPAITWSTSANTVIAYSTNLPPGNYTMSFSITLQGAYVANFIYLGSNVFLTELNNYRTSFVPSAFPYTICAGSYTFRNTVTRDISLINNIGNSQTLINGYWNIVRLS